MGCMDGQGLLRGSVLQVVSLAWRGPCGSGHLCVDDQDVEDVYQQCQGSALLTVGRNHLISSMQAKVQKSRMFNEEASKCRRGDR